MTQVIVEFLTSPCAICGKVAHDHMLMVCVGPVCRDCQSIGKMRSAARLAGEMMKLTEADT